MKKIGLILSLLIILAVSSGCAAVLEKYNAPVDETSTDLVLVTVEPGSSTTGIANTLLDLGLIQNVNAFKAKAKLMEVDGQMQAGDYQLSKAMSTEEIINKLVDGDVYIDTVKFTIPEGYEIRQIADRLEEMGLIDRATFYDILENYPFDYRFLEGVDRQYDLEGYLFPDTYEIARKDVSELNIITMMLDRFDEIFDDSDYDRAEEIGMSVNQVITLASIIEREGKLQEEFPIISSVFHNRVDISMSLQSCATVQYVLQERKENLTNDDIAIDSPFNTYLYAGLPPAPIASPGEVAIEAALYPADTDYLYFVLKETNDGSHYFNSTLEGHNRDKAKRN